MEALVIRDYDFLHTSILTSPSLIRDKGLAYIKAIATILAKSMSMAINNEEK